MLVSVNPFRQLPIYTISVMHEFARPSPNRLLPPHTFALANSAYLQMRVESLNQAILISGESGAGQCLLLVSASASPQSRPTTPSSGDLLSCQMPQGRKGRS